MTGGAERRLEADVKRLEAAIGPVPPAEERPAFVILSGLPGSGKSHVARELAKRYPLAVLHIDALRKTLVPQPQYTQAEHARTFAAVHALIDRLLARKVSVLYDATNLKEEYRRPLYEIGERNGARVKVVRVVSPEEVALRRLRERREGSGERWSSDADEDVYEMMRLEAEPVAGPHAEVDASGDVSEAVDKIVRKLREDV